MIEVARLRTDGTLNIMGDLNERIPAITNGLVAHYPLDSRAGCVDVINGHMMKQHIASNVNLMEAVELDWRDPANWTHYHQTGTLSYDAERDALKIENGWWGHFNPMFEIDTSRKWYVEAKFFRESGEGVCYLGNRSYDINKNQVLGHPGTHDYYGATGYKPTMGQWVTYNNSKIGGEPRTGESATQGHYDKWHPGTVYSRFLFIASYNNAAGVYYIKDLKFYYVDDDDSNTVISEDGIEVFEETENVVTNTNLDTGWSKGYCTAITWNEIEPPEGIDSPVAGFIDTQMAGESGAGSGYWYCYGNYAPQIPGVEYTISIYAKTRDPNFKIVAYTANNSEKGRYWGGAKTIPNDGEWHRVTWTFTNAADSESDSLSFYFTYGEQNSGELQRTWLCAPQMEPKAFATTFVGGGVRGKGALTASAPVKATGTISLDFMRRDNGGWCVEGLNANAPILSMASTSLYIYTGDTTNLQIWLANTVSVEANRIVATNKIHDNVKHNITFTWNNAQFDAYLDGEWIGEFTDFGHLEILDQLIYIGCESTHGRVGNTVFSNLSVYNRVLTADEIKLNVAKAIRLTSDGDFSLEIEEGLMIDDPDIYYFPLNENGDEWRGAIKPAVETGVVYDRYGLYVGSSTTNLLNTYVNLGAADVKDEDGWIKVTNRTAGHGIRCYALEADLTDGEIYTCSAVVYNPNDFDVPIAWDWNDVVSGSKTIKPKETAEIKLTGSRADYTSVYRFFDIIATIIAPIWVKDIQIEHEQWKTPYVETSRPASQFYYLLPDILKNDADWTVAVLAKANTQNMNAYPGNGRVGPIAVGDYYDVNESDIFWMHNWTTNADGGFNLGGYNNQVSKGGGATNLTPEEYNEYCAYIIKYDSTNDTVYGTIITPLMTREISAPNRTLDGLIPKLILGGYDWDYGNWDSYLKDCIVAKRLMTTEELEEIYQSKMRDYNDKRVKVLHEIIEGGVS